MDTSNPLYIAKNSINYINDDMDEEIVSIFLESESQKEVARSSRPRCQRRNAQMNHEVGHLLRRENEAMDCINLLEE